jgi:hypothetical protein
VGRLSGPKLRQWWWIAFVLGCLMINYPFLRIFDRNLAHLGIPLLYLYLFLGWLAGIAVIGCYTWALRKAPDEGEG